MGRVWRLSGTGWDGTTPSISILRRVPYNGEMLDGDSGGTCCVRRREVA